VYRQKPVRIFIPPGAPVVHSDPTSFQLVLEQAAAGASTEQVRELEAIDGKVYRLLFPALAQESAQVNRPVVAHGALNPF